MDQKGISIVTKRTYELGMVFEKGLDGQEWTFDEFMQPRAAEIERQGVLKWAPWSRDDRSRFSFEMDSFYGA